MTEAHMQLIYSSLQDAFPPPRLKNKSLTAVRVEIKSDETSDLQERVKGASEGVGELALLIGAGGG
jgi:hypothetical protein